MNAQVVFCRDDDTPLTPQQMTQAVCEYDVICPTVTDRITAEQLLHRNRRVRLIANYGVGFNHIDVATAKQQGVAVTNTPGVLTDATADLTMALLLATARATGAGERLVRAGQWQGWSPTHFVESSADVSGATLGLVGLGRIGLATAYRARFGFNMKILFYKRGRTEPSEEVCAALGARRCDSLEEMLPHCDFVSMHCPASAETKHIINSDRLALMKSSSILINTARGDVVDTAALVTALREKKIKAAGLDVYENEPSVPAELLQLENVVLLPHLGSCTSKTRVAMGQMAWDNVLAFLQGKPLLNQVN